MDVYSKYVAWCTSIGITPASIETYEKTVAMIDDRPRCAICSRVPVIALGNVCTNCMAHSGLVAKGQAE